MPTSAAFSQIQWIQYQAYAKKNMLLLTKVSRTRFATPARKENWLFAHVLLELDRVVLYDAFIARWYIHDSIHEQRTFV